MALSSLWTPSKPVVWTHVVCSGRFTVPLLTPCVLIPPLAAATAARGRAALLASSRYGPSAPPPSLASEGTTLWPTLSRASTRAVAGAGVCWREAGRNCSRRDTRRALPHAVFALAELSLWVCPTFYTHGSSAICGPFSRKSAMSERGTSLPNISECSAAELSQSGSRRDFSPAFAADASLTPSWTCADACPCPFSADTERLAPSDHQRRSLNLSPFVAA